MVAENKKDNKRINLKVYHSPNNKCRIELKDNGYGIQRGKATVGREKDFIEDIFMDFTTTKSSIEGTGMGLSRVRKIVELHNGRVWAQSKGKGHGATFIIELPVENGGDNGEV